MLTLEQKLYQLIINRLDGEKLSSSPYREYNTELVQKGIGGFIIFGGRKDDVKAFVKELQSLAEIPLFIASDIERGAGQQIDGAASFPPQMAVAAAFSKDNENDIGLLEKAVRSVADEALDIGINMPFIPVLDVNRNPDNPIICTRAFSDDPDEVAWFGRLYIRVLEHAGLISCAKHFPGHGDTDTDSHISLPIISKSLKELMDIDVFPFREAIKEHVSSIMTGHLSIPALDERPVPFSGKAITDLLRNELEYEGLILTDALNMDALNEAEYIPAACMNAGMDILLHPADADEVVDELEQAIESARVSEDKINAAVGRILKYKSKIANIQKTGFDLEEHCRLSETISERSITLVKEKPGLFPLKNVQGVSSLYYCDREDFDISPLTAGVFDKPVRLELVNRDGLKDTVLISLFTNIAAWRGSSGIAEESITAVREIIKRPGNSVVISFGSPYVLKHFTEADALIAAYDSGRQAQLSVMKCLKGEKDFKGRLPVRI